MATIDTVIFDLGNVLIKWDPRNLYRKLFSDEKEMDYFLANICTGHWNELQDAGRPIKEATQLLVDQYPKYESLIRDFYGRWSEMLGGPIHGTVDILKEVHQAPHLRLYALTNWSAETFPIALERYDFLQLFEGILVSGDEKLKKPDPKIYQLILQRYNINPATSIFIDDSQRNVDGAKAVGIHAVHFVSPEQLRKDLEGVL